MAERADRPGAAWRPEDGAPRTAAMADIARLAGATYSVPPHTELLCAPTGSIVIARQRFGHAPGGATEIAVPRLARHVVLMHTDADGLPYEVRIAGRRMVQRPTPGCVVLLPAGMDSHWIKRGLADRVLHLHLDPGWLAGLAEEEGLDRALAGLAVRHLDGDPVLSSLAASLEAERAHGPLLRAFAEHWSVLVALRLMRLPEALPRRDYALPPRRLAAVCDFVEANLAQDIGLAEMAAIAGLSRFHFARAFKRETGLAPHAFLTARRARLAKRLLEEGALPLAGVAEACGFGSAARLAQAFRRLTGATPTQWRRARRE